MCCKDPSCRPMNLIPPTLKIQNRLEKPSEVINIDKMRLGAHSWYEARFIALRHACVSTVATV